MKTLFQYFTGCLIAGLVCLMVMPSWAAIGFQSITDGTNNAGATTHTTSVTVSAGADLIMIACVQSSGNAGVPATGVVYNGSEAFTAITADSGVWSGSIEANVSLWYLLNPTVTTANAVVTFSTAGNDRTEIASYVVLTGASASQPDASNHFNNNAGSTTISTTVTTVAANSWIVDCALSDLNGTPTVGANQTQRTNGVVGAASNSRLISTVDGLASPGAETMDWTQTSAPWTTSAASFAPAVAAAVSSGGNNCGALMLLGVGGC